MLEERTLPIIETSKYSSLRAEIYFIRALAKLVGIHTLYQPDQ